MLIIPDTRASLKPFFEIYRSAAMHRAILLPSVDKDTHAWQRVFPTLFALFALMGYDTSASQKPKITRKSIAVRCKQFWRGRKAVRRRKGRREYFVYFQGLWGRMDVFLPVKTVCVLVNRGYCNCWKSEQKSRKSQSYSSPMLLTFSDSCMQI